MLALIVIPALAQKTVNQPVPVFVTSVGATGGLTDPSRDNQDSVRDLQKQLANRKMFRLAAVREDAVIVLVVLDRIRSGAGKRYHTVRVKLLFRGYEVELTGEGSGAMIGLSEGAWGRAAGKIATQVERWVIANRTKLAETAR